MSMISGVRVVFMESRFPEEKSIKTNVIGKSRSVDLLQKVAGPRRSIGWGTLDSPAENCFLSARGWKNNHGNVFWFSIFLCFIALIDACNGASAYKEIQVVDDQTGRGVPLVELETVNHLRYMTDSAGRVAFFEPGLMNQAVFFYVRSHGY